MTDDRTLGTIAAWGAGIAITVLLAVGLGVAGWQFGWWLKAKNVDRQTHLEDRSFARQTTLTAAVNGDVTSVRAIDVQITQANPEAVTALKAQRIAIVNDACTNAGLLTHKANLPTTTQSFLALECP